ncbi:DUF1003 domain-containing protein [Cryptosporangium aurantiacum]|uniref:Uncharacterized membrane protein n=1 Tax=Cryptosporangium aurantiacum TaxID=134849 RepID=A0A1M7QPU5_9ACTN|nr:DUF1003 domain-containing protein [Cryptosporangium aurantiacum]SHN33461.1 Uncharacterized membrane protein [Cryptosporangium aurantiacum]
MSDVTRSRSRLDQPRERRRRLPRFDADAFGRGSERVAQFLGTGTFILMQTVIVIVWVTLNIFAVNLRWDPYPFILLNLAFSTQAAYAAPLILLAQNRQADRDRISLEEDRLRAQAAKADTEYLARELAALRLALGEVATREYLRSELGRVVEELREPSDADADLARPAGESRRAERRLSTESRRDTDGRRARLTR